MRNLTTLLYAVAALAALIALFTPWWTGDFAASGSGMSSSGSGHAGPFNNGDGMVDGDGPTTLVGVLMALGLVGLVAAAVLALLRPGLFATLPAAVALLLVALAVILAPTTWPGDGGFWSDSHAGFGGMSASSNTYAGAGWYIGLGSAVIGLVGLGVGLLGAHEPEAAPDAAKP